MVPGGIAWRRRRPYVFAIGVGWGAYWLLTGFGVDVGGFVAGLVSSDGIGWFWTSVFAVLALGAFGAAGLALNYFVEYWGFELARVPGEKGTLLRTRQGLFTTRTVNRDVNRMRGVRSGVSTIAVRESLLQRRLGLRTVSVMTAAGTGGYTVPDLAADESLRFADRAAPGLLGPFLRPRDADEPA